METHHSPGMGTRLAALLALAIALDTLIQLSWKAAASRGPVLTEPLFYAAMGTWLVQLAIWLRVLARADLSYAQPITALSYISVAGLSAVLFHERLSPTQGAGIALILAGVFLISRTPARTAGAP
jgi:drug/metabolite transporter (DMT)-like permease